MDVHPNTVLRGEPRFSPAEKRFRIALTRVGRHRLSAVHVRAGRSWHRRSGAHGVHGKGCGLNRQYRYSCSRDQENFLGLLHFLPSLWNRPLGREENRERAQAVAEWEGIARETKQGALFARGFSLETSSQKVATAEALSKRGEIGARITPLLLGQAKGQVTGLTPLRNIRMEFAVEALYFCCRHTSPHK
jgi:hypothetical protein